MMGEEKQTQGMCNIIPYLLYILEQFPFLCIFQFRIIKCIAFIRKELLKLCRWEKETEGKF